MPKSREEYNEYMRKYMKDWYDRRRAQAIEQLDGRCVRCGSTENLEFDHVDPSSKTMVIAKMWTASRERFQSELAKCQLLCKPCHREKTLEDLGQERAKGTHGTLSAYQYCGPVKCEPCKAAKRQYMQEYMKTYQRKLCAVNSVEESTILNRVVGCSIHSRRTHAGKIQ